MVGPSGEDARHRVRVLIFGYGKAPVGIGEFLNSVGAEIAAVVLPGDRRGDDHAIVRRYAEIAGLSVLVHPRENEHFPGFRDACRGLAPDLIIVYSYSMRITPNILELPRLGTVNLHGGLLPHYRGPHVMNWAIINGETKTGVTAHYMDADWDTGPVIGMATFPIEWDDDAYSVREKLHLAAVDVLASHWEQIASGTVQAQPQDETRARYWPKRTPEDGRIDWHASPVEIRNLVRALVPPWPGAFTFLGPRRVVILRAQPSGQIQTLPEEGTISCQDLNGIQVATRGGWLRVEAVQVGQSLAQGSDIRSLLDCRDGDRFS